MIQPPNVDRLESASNGKIGDLPSFVRIHRTVDHPKICNVERSSKDAIDSIAALQELPKGSEIGITAGSRGISNIGTILKSIIQRLQQRGFNPFLIPAMGSHGGATSEGQVKLLNTLGINETTMGCEIRPSMNVSKIAESDAGRPIYVSTVAQEADAIILLNRIKIHTDFVDGDIESGLHKMAVIGLGKQKGAESAHNEAIKTSFRKVLPDWGQKIINQTPIIGGVGIIENGDEQTAIIEPIESERMLEREKNLFQRSLDLFPTLPVDDIDLLIIDEIGKHISGTGMDTNVVGRMSIHGEPEPESPSVTRIYVKGLTEKTGNNGLGLGLADFVHTNAVESIGCTETYVNAITGSEPERARIPLIMPTDKLAFLSAFSTTGIQSINDIRCVYIRNTAELGEMLVSKPVASELSGGENISAEEVGTLNFDSGNIINQI